MPEVSFVIPSRDRVGLLTRSLSCALSQRDVDLEVVVVDDASTDATPAMLASIGDSRLQVLRHDRPSGASASRNGGIEAAAGQWLGFLDDDDLWAPDKIGRQLEAAKATGRRWVCGGTVVVDESLRIVGGGEPPPPEAIVGQLPVRNIVYAGASNVLVRRDLLKETGVFDVELRHMADWDLWIRLAQVEPPAVVALPLVAYLIHPGNASLDLAGILAEMGVIERRYSELRKGRRLDKAYVHRWMAWSALRARKRGQALRSYGRAVRCGDWRSLGRALAAMAHPGVARTDLRRHRPHPAWAIAAESWLEDIRAAR